MASSDPLIADNRVTRGRARLPHAAPEVEALWFHFEAPTAAGCEEWPMKLGERQGWIRMMGAAEAEGRLKEVYAAMHSGSAPRPSVYTPRSGDAPNIVRCHSLDPEGLRLTFSLSGAISWGPLSLGWVERELINTVTSQTNGCHY